MGTKDTGNGGKKDQEGGGTAATASAASGVDAQQGKLEMIRVKRLKFTLKGSNYEDAQQAGLSGVCTAYNALRTDAADVQRCTGSSFFWPSEGGCLLRSSISHPKTIFEETLEYNPINKPTT